MNSNTIAIIPSRMAATRFPGKPLAPILGIPLIRHCYERTKIAFGRDSTFVATCDNEIKDYIEGIGGKVVMTSDSHIRATTRTAEALEIIQKEGRDLVDIVVMVQGDEPLVSPSVLQDITASFASDSTSIVNVASRIKEETDYLDKNNVKVVFNSFHEAIYFSREPIPSPWKGFSQITPYMQTGIIAFRPSALLRFIQTPESPLEKIESIDMNRVIESAGKIQILPIEDATIGVDVPSDIILAERLLANDPTYLEMSLA
jgi:3-deoxy-manno-octulosonate cytidylyltransferase (CMP-KDO synthetase)